MRSRNQFARAAFSGGSDAARLGAHRTPEKPGRQTNLRPALARANPKRAKATLPEFYERERRKAARTKWPTPRVTPSRSPFVMPSRPTRAFRQTLGGRGNKPKNGS